MRNNRIHDLPPEICDCLLLRELKLDYNFFSSLPTQINKLKQLSHLSVSQNNLKLIPHNVLLLGSSLEHLILNDNKIASIPSKIGGLYKLKTLFLHNNMIVDIPSTMYRIKHLS